MRLTRKGGVTPVPVRLKVTNEIVEAAIELIDRRWGGLISADTMLDRLLQQVDKLRRLADPKLNDNEHERRAAEAKLRELENRCDVHRGLLVQHKGRYVTLPICKRPSSPWLKLTRCLNGYGPPLDAQRKRSDG